MSKRIERSKDSHHSHDLPPRMRRLFRLEQPDENAQQRRMIKIRINHVSRMGRKLTEGLERRITLRRRSLIVERVEDKRHERS